MFRDFILLKIHILCVRFVTFYQNLLVPICCLPTCTFYLTRSASCEMSIEKFGKSLHHYVLHFIDFWHFICKNCVSNHVLKSHVFTKGNVWRDDCYIKMEFQRISGETIKEVITTESNCWEVIGRNSWLRNQKPYELCFFLDRLVILVCSD